MFNTWQTGNGRIFYMHVTCNLLMQVSSKICYIYSPKKETQHVKKYNLLQIFNIILNTEISITLH
jgi:hypothetical protein